MADGVKVRDVQGNSGKVGSSEAQDGLAAGRYELDDEEVRVVGPDNRTAYFKKGDIGDALAQGWRLASEGEATAAKSRREAVSTVGTIRGAAETVASGASLGLSDVAMSALGVDAKGIKARREGLGEGGIGLEIAGGIAATVATGGLGGAAQTVGRGGLLARGLAGAGRAIAAPSRLAARVGLGVERGLAGAEAGLARRVAASTAGGAIDGALGGLGGAVSESVLSDKDMTAEAVVGSVLAGAAFGGAGNAVGGLGEGAFGRLLRGAEARRGGDVADGAMRDVMARDMGVPADELTGGMIDAAKKTEGGFLSDAAERLAPLSGADPAIARRVVAKIEADPKRWNDVFNRRKAIEEEVAETFQQGLAEVQESLGKARKLSGGEAKYGALEGKLPKNADFVSPRIAEEQLGKLGARLDDMVAQNEATFARSYDVGAVRETQRLVGRAREELLTNTTTGEVSASSAARAFQSIDRLKRDLSEQISSTGGWGAPPHGTTTDVVAANKAMKEMYGEVKTHLERDDLYGAAAEAQREINGAYSRVAQAQQAFKSGAAPGLKKLFNPDGTISSRQALTLARQHGRMGGGEVVAQLDEALEAQLDYLRTVQKHYDVDGAAVREAEDAVTGIRERFESQRETAEFLDDAQSLRDAESARSVSMGAMSSLGPGVGAALGLSVGGPIGAAIGALAGGVVRPYTTARTMASLLSMTKGFGRPFRGGRLVARLRAGLKKSAPSLRAAAVRSGEEARALGRSGLRAGAFQVGKGTAEQRGKKARRVAQRIHRLGSPEGIRTALGPEFEVFEKEAPETAAAIEGVITTAVKFLSSKAPAFVENPYSGVVVPPNPRDVDRWLRYRGVIVRPRSVVDRVLDGTVTPDDVEALAAVYPRHLEQLRDQVQESMAASAGRGRPVPYRGRLRLSRVLDLPLDPSLDPQRLARSQAMMRVDGAQGEAQQQAQTQQAKPSSGIRSAGVDDMDTEGDMTSAERITSR